MPRKQRYILPNIPHHTIQRGNNRQNIFFEKEDYEYFLSKLKTLSAEHGVGIGAYCLMTNHIHLLCYPETEAGMIKCMKLICQFYTQYINKKYKRSGKLWENRYKIHWIDPDREWVLLRYIEKNPLRAGMVRIAEDYEYSSARGHLLGGNDRNITREVVGAQRRASYREFFAEDDEREVEISDEITKTVEQCTAYGGSDFMRKLERLIGISVEYRERGRPKKIEK